MHKSLSHAFIASAAVTLGTLVIQFGAHAAATPKKVVFNGNTYYVVDGNNTALDSGNEVCGAVGMVFDSYKSINTTGVCKALHPTAKEVVSVNGSKAGFYCNGLPQKGLACEKFKNTCQVCPACNLNAAADGNQTIGSQFAEMYVWCKPKAVSSVAKSSAKAGTYGALPLPKTSSSATGNSVTCTFPQKPLKRVTCGAVKAADTYCVTTMGSNLAKAIACSDTGNVVCSLPCSAPGASNLKQCAFGGTKSGNCPAPVYPSQPANKLPGEICKHGGECTTGHCVGVGPDYGKVFRCSCHMFSHDYSCSGKSSSAPSSTKKTAGQTCVHGGDCQSGMCLGIVPGQHYVCSCIDPITQWQGCRK